MTNKELIELLQTRPENERCLLLGYEGGFNDVKSIIVVRAILNMQGIEPEVWMGRYDNYDDNRIVFSSELSEFSFEECSLLSAKEL